MKSPLEVDYILVCEDIRQEIGSKPSLMGIFTDDILVKDFPAIFPKFCFFVHFKNWDGKPKKITLDASLERPGNEVTILTKDNEIKVQKGSGGILSFSLLGVKFEKPGICTFKLKVGKRTYRHKFSLKKATDPAVFER